MPIKFSIARLKRSLAECHLALLPTRYQVIAGTDTQAIQVTKNEAYLAFSKAQYITHIK